MRLYVHYESSDESQTWTKRLNVDKTKHYTVRSVLCSFVRAYNLKFCSKTPLELENVDVYVEFDHNATCRRRLDTFDILMNFIDDLETHQANRLLLPSDETWSFELVVVPKNYQKIVIDAESPVSLESQKTCSIQQSKSASSDLKLSDDLKRAARYMIQQKYRAAREIYTEVLMKEAQNPEALVALGEILMLNGRHEKAIRQYFIKCWKEHGLEYMDKGRARVVFTSALRLVECYIAMKKFDEAVMISNEMETFLRDNGLKKLEFGKQLKVLKAQALYHSKIFENQEQAIFLLEHLLPDLTASTLNLDALLVYAQIAHDRGKKSEALSMVLRVLVKKPNDRAVKMTLVSFLVQTDSIDCLKEAVPLGSPSAGAAYAFIATVLKDYSAVDQAITCFQLAQTNSPENASYALNHAHVLEISCRYAEAYDVLILFFRKNRTVSVGNGEIGVEELFAGSFVDILDRANAWDGTHNAVDTSNSLDRDKALHWSVDCVSEDAENAKVTTVSLDSKFKAENFKIAFSKKPSSMLLAADLDLLACFFTVVKILFLTGRLAILPSLVRVLEPMRLGFELHRTTIRNEQAYYACIAQLLTINKLLNISRPQLSLQTSLDSIYVCGDSHTLATAWRELCLRGESILLRPALVTGLKHWHLRNESTFYPKFNFWRVITNIPCKSRVIFLFGEIDCRDGILNAVNKCKYETIQEGMAHTIDIFMNVLSDVVKQYQFDAYIHPIVPVLDETRSLVLQYNKIFQKRVAQSSICKWLDFLDELITLDDPPKLRPEYELDGTHLHPLYLSKLETALSKASSR
ncbi:Tetratricopeptide-like helical [Plasmopara halstedii]|uniref:Tetratricopeptide-like helical n=1 Tax=Plasmopara halstedii TaxID=4781 RepID=A0A0P1AEN1_PLAHL|nr:Tetratricopeptide-like helical [Plasmopara halstedii]CEG39301.1 Tetratricopeptide-like helical [Plasmopara halstedii]|eukprot:XP_024575670.1 Tetratricopeptide-like helical [Plasmopara halstedii]